MRKLLKIGLLLLMLMLTAGNVNAYTNDGNGNCNCNSCNDCTVAILDGTLCTHRVTALNDISKFGESTYCIDLDFQSITAKTFSCNEHKMYGNLSDENIGIHLHSFHSPNFTIEHCNIHNFEVGIYIDASDNITINECSVHNNLYEPEFYNSIVYTNRFSCNSSSLCQKDYPACWCSSCGDCSNHSTFQRCTDIYLENNISSTNTCINFGSAVGKNMYCEGYSVTGTGNGNGIAVLAESKVYDCNVSSFYNCIKANANLNQINNSLASSCVNGFSLSGSSNFLSNSNATNNLYGISSTDENSLSNVRSCGNTYWDIFSEYTQTFNKVFCDKSYYQSCNYDCESVICSSCEDCSNNEFPKRFLTSKLYAVGDCINLTSDGSQINCEGHIIDGNDTRTAITVKGNSVVVNSCDITQFYNSIEIHNSSDVSIINNTLHHIRRYPLLFNNSNVSIVNNTMYENSWSRGYKEYGTNELTWTNNSIIVNYSCADDSGCIASLLFAIIAGGGLTVYYFRRTTS